MNTEKARAQAREAARLAQEWREQKEEAHRKMAEAARRKGQPDHLELWFDGWLQGVRADYWGAHSEERAEAATRVARLATRLERKRRR